MMCRPTCSFVVLCSCSSSLKTECSVRQVVSVRSTADLPRSLLFTALGRASLSRFGPLGSIFGATAATFCNAIAIQRTTNDVVAHAGQVLHTPTPDKYDGMLLQIMPFTWDVSGYFHLVCETHAGNLAHCRIRLLRCHSTHLCANASFLGRATQARRPILQRVVRVQQRRCLDLLILLPPSLTD
jgi:hypothetical protein